VIVQFKTAAGVSDVAADGATAKAELPLVHAQLVTVRGSSLATLAAHDSVAYISPNRKLLGAMDPVVTAVNADIASSQGWDGTGVGVAVIDSVGTVDDLNSDGNSSPSRVVYSQSFVPGDSSTTDAYGHGTHVRYRRWKRYDSTSLQNYPDVYRGIAPEANIVSLRVLDSTGASVDSAVIAAIQQAISLQSIYNIRVINLSLSRGVYESYTLDPLCRPLNPRGKQASWWWPRQATWVNTMEPARMDTPPSARPATIPS
jgi:serine protease AprX